MRPQHGVEFSMKELNSTSWNVGETPNVSIVSVGLFLWVGIPSLIFYAMYSFVIPSETR